MIKLGVTRKDLGDGYYGCSPCCSSDDPARKSEWEQEVIHPSLDLNGKHAELFGADDLELGDMVEVTLKLQVTSLRDNSRLMDDGKKTRDLNLGFKLLEASDLTDAGSAGDESSETKSAAGGSAPVDAILGK